MMHAYWARLAGAVLVIVITCIVCGAIWLMPLLAKMLLDKLIDQWKGRR